MQELKSEIVRSTEDEVAARHGVAAEGCVADGFIAFIGEIDALEIDLEFRRDVIVHAEVERQVAGICKALRAASRHVVQIEVCIPFPLRVGDAEVVAVRTRICGISAQMVLENFSFSFGKIERISHIKKEGDKPSFFSLKSSYFSCLIICNFSTMRFSAQRGGLRFPDSQFSMVRRGIKRSSDILFCVKPAACRAPFIRALISPSSFRLSPTSSFVTSRCRDDKSHNRQHYRDLLHFIRMADIMEVIPPLAGERA